MKFDSAAEKQYVGRFIVYTFTVGAVLGSSLTSLVWWIL